jgi:colanic acid biosynthesis glycosyl transferase WcaI
MGTGSITRAVSGSDKPPDASVSRTRPRLCILTQYFLPEMGAAQNRLAELGTRLVKLGWQVEVLTALPNYPTGKIFDGYIQNRPMVDELNGMRLVRLPLYTTKGGFTRRLRSYFSFVGSAMRYGPSLCTVPDMLYVESPPLFIAYAAWYLSWRWKCPYVLSVSDLWPE